MSASVIPPASPTAAKVAAVVAPQTFIQKVKAWFYVASNRTSVVAFLTAAGAEIGSIMDKSVSPIYGALFVAYGLVHLIFPDFVITPADLSAIATDAAKVEVAAAPLLAKKE
jgi:hypothetical protein